MLGSGYEALSEAVNVRATALTSCYKFSLVFAQVLPWGTQVENLPSNMVCVFVVARLKLNCIFFYYSNHICSVNYMSCDLL